MRRIAFLLATAFVSLSVQAQLDVKELKLSNGMTVWLNEDHSQPKVFGAVVVKAGAKDCPNTGIAHYFEHIMFKGTDRMGTTDYEKEKPWLDSISAEYDLLSRTKDEAVRTRIQKRINELSLKASDYIIPNEFNRLISKYGGSELNAGTSYDMTFYHNSFLPQFLKQWCWLNSERLINPVFRGFQGELENVYEEKNRTADNMGDAVEKVFTAVFKTQPYAYPVIGSTESLKNPRLSDMEAFYKKYYVASNMGLILCGDIKPDARLTVLLEQTFGRVQTGPVPVRTKSEMPVVTAGERQKIKLPIPLIGAEVLIFKAPADFESDANALELTNMLLSNGKAGKLDSLVNEHKVMMSAAGSMSLDDAAGSGILIIPKLFGKMKKAEAQVMEQIQQVMDGQFSDEQMEALKQEMVMEAQRDLETIDSRSGVLISVFSKGRTWQDVLDKIENIHRLTRQDVVAAARKYYGANYITLVKKYGTPDKETLKQPGYKPVNPKNTDAKSDFARQLEQLPVEQASIRTVDLERDVTTIQLESHIPLYYKENPVNDIFSFTIRYKDGDLHTPALKYLANYLSQLGTDSLKKQQLEQAWQRISTTMEIVSGDVAFSMNLTGPENQLEPALKLLAHFLHSAKGDDKALNEVKDNDKVERKAFGKQKDDVVGPMVQKVLFGQQSAYLTQLNNKEVKALKNEDLMNLFHELQQYECELFYSGKKPLSEVSSLMEQTLPLSQCRRPQADTFRPARQYDEPTVFFYHVPKSRQNLVISYDAIDALPTAQERAVLRLWSGYFGGGMSSVLFQNVREFRSLAYSTGGKEFTTSRKLHPDERQGYVTVTGTQADKTMEALSTIDTLLHQMPMKTENLEAARQGVLNDIQNAFPTFRTVGKYVANQHRDGYDANPETEMARLVPKVTAKDIEQFHQRHVGSHKNRVWVVIGDRKLTDMKALARYGKVVELKKEDVCR